MVPGNKENSLPEFRRGRNNAVNLKVLSALEGGRGMIFTVADQIFKAYNFLN